MSSFKPGLGAVGSYQVSGKPWAQAGIDATSATSVSFPSVSRWVYVENSGSGADLRVGFSSNGIVNDGTNYVVVRPNNSLGPLEWKVTQLHLSGGTQGGVSVAAGLTFISNITIDNPQLSSGSAPTGAFLNWSGSAGVG